MKKSDVTQMYSMEELIPIVTELTAAFTDGASSSIPYERAQKFMEAVIYCIAHSDESAEREYSLTAKQKLPAQKAYQIGLAAVIENVKHAQQRYNQLIPIFDAYGNHNYRDTVEKLWLDSFCIMIRNLRRWITLSRWIIRCLGLRWRQKELTELRPTLMLFGMSSFI